MAVTIEKVAKRVYFVGAAFADKDRIKDIGAKWDGDRRQWWIGTAKTGVAESLAAELNGSGGAIMIATEGSAAVANSLGLSADTPAGIVADKMDDDGRSREAARVRAGQSAQQNPREIRLTGKGRYKGREYYAGSLTKDGARVRLLTLPDTDGKYLDFWAPCVEVEQIKTYAPRQQWDGQRYSGRTVTVYTTLGSIADFIAQQKRDAGTGRERVQCHECDSWYDADESCRNCGGC